MLISISDASSSRGGCNHPHYGTLMPPRGVHPIYNRKRLHSALHYLTPEEYEKTLSTPSENAVLELNNMKLSRNFSVLQ